jgi:hypothetical protein
MKETQNNTKIKYVVFRVVLDYDEEQIDPNQLESWLEGALEQMQWAGEGLTGYAVRFVEEGNIEDEEQ